MALFYHYFSLSLPLFAIVFGGYVLARIPGWQSRWTRWATGFIFTIALPALLFRLMSNLDEMPAMDIKVLGSFFGGCFIVFALARVVAARWFQLDGVGQSVFAMGTVFSNNVLLGLPLAHMMLGPNAMPTVALVLIFNALILWTLVSVSVEWARNGSFTLKGIGKTTLGVIKNPLVASIALGTLFGMTGWELPTAVDTILSVTGSVAAPGALLILGMGLVQYGVHEGWRESVAITFLKLIVSPLVVWILALLFGLDPIETHAVVLLASMSVGVNVYVMSIQFKSMESAVAGSLVLSTIAAAFTTPLLLTLMALEG